MDIPLTEKRSAKSLPIAERYSVTVGICAAFIGISRSRIYELLKDGILEGRIVAGRRVVIVASMMRMLGQAPTTKREDAT